MQTLYRYCIVLFFAFSTLSVCSSLDNSKFSSLSAEGRDFWLAVPLNDAKATPVNQLDFYITSKYNTLVTLEVRGAGFIRSKKLRANETMLFTTKDGSASYDFEIVTSEIADPRGIHIYSEHPISVYVLNSKELTSDGYLALPTNTFGTEYIHCSYYDYSEIRPWAGGFIIIASEDKTEVFVTLRGRGGNFAKTKSGYKIGQTLGPIILNKGEVYNVVGDGTTKGVFDLTGSKISSNKPIGLISYHERTMLPANNTNGRDHMCEMIPPVSAWGKKHYSIEFQRDNKGDFFRVVASKANTFVRMKYYDKVTKELSGQRDIVLSKAGDFYEDYNTWVGNDEVTGFTGITVWEANKPILVMQYAYSADWDSGSKFDPFMLVLTPQEQYLSSTTFQIPTANDFTSNFFSFIVEGDTSDIDKKKLKSIVLDKDTLYKSYSQLFDNNIPGTNLYWGQQPVAPGVHTITSNTHLGGYVYGFGTNNSYGWAAVLGTKSLTDLDTLPPIVSYTKGGCGDFTFHATELRDYGPPPPDAVQIDQGIFDISLNDSLSYNYELKLLTADKVVPLPKVTVFDFKLQVKDKTKDAFAVVAIIDRAGNYVLDTVRYKADKLPEVTPSLLSFRTPIADTTIERTLTISNTTLQPVMIDSIFIYGTLSGFSLLDSAAGVGIVFAPGAKYTVKIRYKPNNKVAPSRDTLSVNFALCGGEILIPLEGVVVQPFITVNPPKINFTGYDVDSTYTRTIEILNPTTDTIYLKSTSLGTATLFTINKGNITSDFPLAPNAMHAMDIQYKPTTASLNKKDIDTLLIKALYAQDKRVSIVGTLTTVTVEENTRLSTDYGISVSPNPADKDVTVNMTGNHLQNVQLRLFDAIGREVAASSTEFTNGSSNAVLPNISSLPAGAYRLVATGVDGLVLSSSLLMIQR